MGKGGVGKTTIAAAVAVELASRGYPVHLTTSDPAAHLAETLEGSLDHLTVSRIEPHVETEVTVSMSWTPRVKTWMRKAKALLEEDLRSPCTEEIAVFQAFSRIIREAGKKFVVMDTRANRPYIAIARCDRSLSPRDGTATGCKQHAFHDAHDAVAGCQANQSLDRYLG